MAAPQAKTGLKAYSPAGYGIPGGRLMVAAAASVPRAQLGQ